MPLDDSEKAQILSRVERVHAMIAELERSANAPLERAMIRDRMRRELEAVKQAIKRLSTNDPT
jgi:DNA invertase Pin-like site-specific DNA recombinase